MSGFRGRLTQLAIPARGALVKIGHPFPNNLLPGAAEKHDKSGLGTVMAIFFTSADEYEPEGYEVLTVADVKLAKGSLPARLNELISTPPAAWKERGVDPTTLIPQLVEELGQAHPGVLAEGCCSVRVPMKIEDGSVFPVSRLAFPELLDQIQRRVAFAGQPFAPDEPDDDEDEEEAPEAPAATVTAEQPAFS